LEFGRNVAEAIEGEWPVVVTFSDEFSHEEVDARDAVVAKQNASIIYSNSTEAFHPSPNLVALNAGDDLRRWLSAALVCPLLVV